MSQYTKYPPASSGSSGVSSLNSLTGALTLAAGSGITITPSGGNTLTIAATSGGGGTVTSVSVVTANGFAGSVATATTTPAITLSTTITGILQGNGTSISAATTGDLTDAGTDGIVVTGGAGAVLGAGASLAQHVADATHNGYLSSTDWNTFNGKGTGSVTSVSVVTANGVSGSVATATTTPAITLTLGAITPSSITVGGTAVLGPNSSTVIHQINGGLSGTTRTASANFTIDTTTTDYIVFANTSGSAFTITLPAPTNGRILIIKDSTGSFNTNNLTLAQHAAEKIEGVASSKLLTTNWGSYCLTSNGTDWFLI